MPAYGHGLEGSMARGQCAVTPLQAFEALPKNPPAHCRSRMACTSPQALKLE